MAMFDEKMSDTVDAALTILGEEADRATAACGSVPPPPD
jgi:hypothetical protein